MHKSALAHLETLIDANARYAAGADSAQRAELARGQAPFATVLACSDSRVPVETVFGCGPGELFVVRVAGNVARDESLASVEYGIEVLKTPLLFVLGHSGCGAVAAAIDRVARGTAFPGHIGSLVEAVVPAARAVSEESDARFDGVVRENVRRSVSSLAERSSLIAAAVADGRVTVRGGVYDLRTGIVALVL